MSEKSSVYVSESISDIIDMEQFYSSEGDIDNISVEISSEGFESVFLLDSMTMSGHTIEIGFTCNATKAALLMFSCETSRVKFMTSSEGCIKDLQVSLIKKSFSLKDDNKYSCKFVADLLSL